MPVPGATTIQLTIRQAIRIVDANDQMSRQVFQLDYGTTLTVARVAAALRPLAEEASTKLQAKRYELADKTQPGGPPIPGPFLGYQLSPANIEAYRTYEASILDRTLTVGGGTVDAATLANGMPYPIVEALVPLIGGIDGLAAATLTDPDTPLGGA